MEQGKKSYYNCSVNNCMNSSLNTEYSFFSLPTDMGRRIEWLKLIDREDIYDTPGKRARVCEAHFSPDFILTSVKRKMLKKNAVPDQQLPQSLLKKCDKEIQTYTEKYDVSAQYDYNLRTNSQVQTPMYLLKDYTPKRKILYENDMEIQACSKKLKITNHTQSEANSFSDLCDQYLNKNLASIVKQQVKFKSQSSEKKFSLDYKIFCLNLYNASPQAYNLWKETLCLPNKQTLVKMHMPITTNIDNHFMVILATKVQHMSEIDRNCSLTIDAMSLKANLCYNVNEDRIYGFHEVDGEQSTEPANHALVAMVHGLFENYKQPVGYALLAKRKNCQSVSEWIEKIIRKLFSIGLHVRILVSDIGTDFFNSASYGPISAERPFFFIGDRKIYYIFDAPHLIKLVRNTLMMYEFHFENSIAKWDHIIQFYEFDKFKQLRLTPKLTDSHLKSTNFKKLEVQYSVEIFSAAVAAGLSIYRDFGLIESCAEGTIKLIVMMNDLFDFLNGSSRQNTISGERNETSFINNISDFFASLQLINPISRQNVTSELKVIEVFQITLKSLLLLFEDLRLEEISYILNRPLNQDYTVDLFENIRTKNENSTKPTTWQLVSGLRKNFFSTMIDTPKLLPDYAEDLANCLHVAEKLCASSTRQEQFPEQMTSNEEQSDRATFNKMPSIKTSDYNTLDLPEKYALVYVSGYLLRKCLDHHKECNQLKAYTREHDSHNFPRDKRYNRYREYCKDATKSLLMIPQDSFVEFVELMEERYCNFFKTNYINCEILKDLLCEIQTLTFPMPCQCFPIDYCKRLFLIMRIYHTLKCNNRGFRQCQNRQQYLSVTNLQ